jgi:pimeloyl-ACP methyl ester carboxylesterase
MASPLAPVPWWKRVALAEWLIAIYFLAGMTLVMTPLYLSLKRFSAWFDGRLPGRAGRRDLGLLPQVLPSLLMLPLILPYVLATLYVHRFKVTNVTTPREEMRRGYEDVDLVTADGLTIRGWFIAAHTPSDRTVLICHGLGANRSNFLPYLAVADELKAHAFLFDFRGHGDSDGHTVTFGQREQLDVRAAVEYLRTQRPEQARRIVGLGISMGSSALIGAAAEFEPPLDGLIIDSGFTTAVELTDSVLALFPPFVRPWLTGPGVPLASLEASCWLPAVRPIDRIARVRAPVLFIHARGDGMIPAEHGQRLYDAASMPKQLWIAETEGHTSALAGATSQYLQTVARWDRPTPGCP